VREIFVTFVERTIGQELPRAVAQLSSVLTKSA
jgi:hypothetical protein